MQMNILYMSAEDIKDNLKLIKNTHIFEQNISEKNPSPYVIAEHYQKKKKKKKASYEPDLDNIKVQCKEDKLIPLKVQEAIFIRKKTSSTLDRDVNLWFTSRNTKFN